MTTRTVVKAKGNPREFILGRPYTKRINGQDIQYVDLIELGTGMPFSMPRTMIEFVRTIDITESGAAEYF